MVASAEDFVLSNCNAVSLWLQVEGTTDRCNMEILVDFCLDNLCSVEVLSLSVLFYCTSQLTLPEGKA